MPGSSFPRAAVSQGKNIGFPRSASWGQRPLAETRKRRLALRSVPLASRHDSRAVHICFLVTTSRHSKCQNVAGTLSTDSWVQLVLFRRTGPDNSAHREQGQVGAAWSGTEWHAVESTAPPGRSGPLWLSSSLSIMDQAGPPDPADQCATSTPTPSHAGSLPLLCLRTTASQGRPMLTLESTGCGQPLWSPSQPPSGRHFTALGLGLLVGEMANPGWM